MIYFIHGDDLVSSRIFFLDKKNKENGILFDGKETLLTDIIQAFEGQSLFFETKNIFIEDFFSKRKPDSEYKKVIDYLKNNEEKISVNFWESKEITKTKTAVFKKPVLKLFKLPQSLFIFLDSLKPKEGLKSVRLFHACLKTCEPEFMLYMLIRQIRILLSLSEKQTPADEFIDEIKRLAPWQKSKLSRQASYFSQEKLLKIHNLLYEMDLESKTGSFPLSLVEDIDFFLLEM